MLSARHGWTLRKDDGVLCTCKPVNPRHPQGWYCLPLAEVEAFKVAHRLKSEQHARSLMFIETFSPELKHG